MPHVWISATCQASTMKRKQRMAAELKALREEMGHLEATLMGLPVSKGPAKASLTP